MRRSEEGSRTACGAWLVTKTIIVSNGSDRPWIMSNLSATPVTRTYIDYDGAGTAWTAWGKPTVAAGKLVFICHTLNSVAAQQAIMWSEEADATVGYQQSGYDNLWEVTQSDTDALVAIRGNAPSGRLHRRLVEKQLAASSFGFFWTLAEPGPPL